MSLTKDALQLIAEQINDPKTYVNFSLCSKHCYDITKRLHKMKTRQFIWNLTDNLDIYQIISRIISPNIISMTLITGGPKSGKTTFLQYLKNKTKHKNYFEVPEKILSSIFSMDHIRFFHRLGRQKRQICVFCELKTNVHEYLDKFQSVLTNRFVMERVANFLPKGSSIIAIAPTMTKEKLIFALPRVDHIHLPNKFNV